MDRLAYKGEKRVKIFAMVSVKFASLLSIGSEGVCVGIAGSQQPKESFGGIILFEIEVIREVGIEGQQVFGCSILRLIPTNDATLWCLRRLGGRFFVKHLSICLQLTG